MTSTATVKKADLRRLAAVAKEAGVSAWVEVDGKKFGVSPDIPDIHNPPQPVKKERIHL
jgi:hypothetical protein